MLTAVPSSLRAGDTWVWTSSYADYPAGDGWVLVTSFRGSSILNVTSTAEGNSWTSTAAASSTAALAAGRYSWFSRVTLDGVSHTVASGVLDVLPNLAAEVAGYDGRTNAEKQLAAAETALTALLGKQNASVSIGDQSFTLQDIEKLIRVRDMLRQQVANEKAAANGTPRRTVKIHFPSC